MKQSLPRDTWAPREVASKLGVSYGQVLKMIRDGQLAAIKVGQLYLIPDESYKALLASAKAGA